MAFLDKVVCVGFCDWAIRVKSQELRVQCVRIVTATRVLGDVETYASADVEKLRRSR